MLCFGGHFNARATIVPRGTIHAKAPEKFRYLHIRKQPYKVEVMSFWPATVLILVAVLSRLAPIWLGDAWPMHFNALTAVALCGAAFLPSRWSLLLPIGALAASDVILDLHYGVSLWEPPYGFADLMG